MRELKYLKKEKSLTKKKLNKKQKKDPFAEDYDLNLNR